MHLLLKNRNFVLLWLSLIISGMGDIFFNVGVMVTIFEQTGSALQTVGVTLATTMPKFLLGPFAGALVDRYPRQWVIVAMESLRAFLVGLLILFVNSQGFSVVGVYLVVVGLAIAETFHAPARLAIIPSLVVPHLLVRANGLIMTTNQAVLAVGYALGGILILRVGFERLVAINLVSFLGAAFLVIFIRLGTSHLAETAGAARPAAVPIWESIREGAAYLRRHGLARPLVIMEVLEHFPHAIWISALMLVFVKEALGGSTDDWGYQNAAFYSGQIAGAMIAALIAGPMARRPGWLIIGNAFLFSLLTIGYALSPTRLFALVLTFLFGPTSAMRDVAQDSLLQATVSREVLGRIYAMRNMMANLSFMLAGAAFAWLADQIPVRWIYVIGGVLYLVTAVYALASRPLRRGRIQEAVTDKMVEAVVGNFSTTE